MKLSNKVYDILKYVALILLPALATLYAAVGKIWDWPLVAEVVGTISAVDVFLGALLQISTNNYNREGKPPEEEPEEAEEE